MSQGLPYFKWYPADAELDAKYASMTDAELGFYHRCLNKAWENNGLPADPKELARLLKVSLSYVNRLWPRVGRCFSLSSAGLLVNPRQERERESAVRKGENNKRPGNAFASREKRERDFPETRTRLNRVLRAFDSDSCTEISGSSKEKTAPSAISQRFEELWNRWPKQFGKHPACRDWCSVVTIDVEDKVFICLENYLASAEVASGAIMNLGSGLRDIGWIMKCHKDGWDCRWPAAQLPGNRLPQPPKPPIPTAEEQIEALRWIAENDEDPNARESAKEQLAGGKS